MIRQPGLFVATMVACFAAAGGAIAQDSSAQAALEAAATASLGGPASAQAQLEQDRIRRLQDSRLPWLDATLDPLETARDAFAEQTGLNLSFDYQALFQQASESLTDTDTAASGQLRMIGSWTLLNRGGENPGSLVFILENRHLLGADIAPSALPGEIGYLGVTGTTFGDTDTTLSIAYWSQAIGTGGFVAGRIDPGDYTDILGYVNPRTTFSNFSVLFNPVLPIPDPGFGIGAGGFLNDQVYALGVVSDANGSLTDIDWFPGGAELFKYVELGWTPARDQRYLTNVHIGAFHVDERTDSAVPESYGLVLSGNVTFDSQLMLYGRLGWSDGSAPIARRAAGFGAMWRPGLYDDLLGIGVTFAEPSNQLLELQTTVEAFYRYDISDNVAITADVQYVDEPGFSAEDPWIFGFRARFNL